MLTKISIFVATIILFNITANYGAPQNRQPIFFPPTTSNGTSAVPNITDITNILNLTNNLPSATAQIQQAIQNLTEALQSSSTNLQQAVQAALVGVSLQGQNIAQGFLTFLTNFKAQLNKLNISSGLTQPIAVLQNFFNSSANGASLQNLVNAVGPNLATAATNLQSQLNSLTQFLQGGLSQLSSTTRDSSNQQNIQTLLSALNNGTFNQILTDIITRFQGKALTFQTLLSSLQQQANTSLQSVISNVQGALQSSLNFMESQFRNVLSVFTGFFQPRPTAPPPTSGMNGVIVIGQIQPKKN